MNERNTDQPSCFDLCRQIAYAGVKGEQLGMNAVEFREWATEQALAANQDLPEPYPEDIVRSTAASTARWARENLTLPKAQQRAMAKRRNVLGDDPYAKRDQAIRKVAAFLKDNYPCGCEDGDCDELDEAASIVTMVENTLQ